MALADMYTTEIRANLKRFATWEPGVPMRLGDYGELHGSRFVRLGNIMDPHLEVSFSRRNDSSNSHVSYSSAGAVSVDFGVEGTVDGGPIAAGRVGLRIRFGREHAVFLNAANVRYHSIADQSDLERQLLELFAQRRWKAGHVVVTEISGAASTTVIVAAGRSGEIVLEAEADAPQIDFADASVQLAVRSENAIGYKAITEDSLTPLLTLSRIRPRGVFWARRHELVREMGFTAGDTETARGSGDLVDQLEKTVSYETMLDQVEAAQQAVPDAFSLEDVTA